MAYDPDTGAWKYENDSVADNVKGLVDVNSPIIQQARTQGVQSANRRGLINSSIAAGASQDAAYKAAVPIATADANITSAANLSAQGSVQQLKQGEQTIQGQKDIQTQTDAATNARLVQQLGSQERVAAAQDAAAKERLGMQLTSQEQTAADQLKNALQIARENNTTSTTNTNATIAGNKVNTDATIAANATNTDKTIAANRDIANNSNSVQTQQFVLTATQNARANANSVINNINSNPNIPAGARQGYINQAETNYKHDIDVIASVANVQIPYTPPVVPTTTAPSPIDPTYGDF